MAKGKRRVFPQIRNEAGLIVVEGTDPMQPLNYLMIIEGRGIYDASYGLCPASVTKEEAEAHNQMLDQMLVTGLDESCKVGQGGMFYFTKNEQTGKPKVATFLGTIISDEINRITGRFYFFRRNDKEFRGTIRRNDTSTFVERIA